MAKNVRFYLQVVTFFVGIHHQEIQDAVPVLLKTIALPVKHHSRLIVRNDIHSMLLGR